MSDVKHFVNAKTSILRHYTMAVTQNGKLLTLTTKINDKTM